MAEAKLIDLGGGEVVVVELEEVREMVRRQWGAEGVECSRVRWVATGEGYVLWGGPGNVHGDEEWEAFGLIAVGGRTPAESAREKGTTCGAGVLKWVCATQLRKGWRICEWDEGAAYVASGPTAVVGVVHVGTASVAAAVLLRAGGEETPGWETKLYCFGPQKHFRVLAVDGFGAKGLGPGAEQRLQCLVALDEDFAMTTVRTPEGGAPGSERSGANALLLPPAKLAQRTTQALVVGAGNGASTSTPDLILATREGEVACVRGGVILWKASLGVEGSKFSRIVRLAPGGLVIFAEFLEKSRMGSIRSFKGFGLGSQSCSVVPSASERVEIIPQSPKSLGSGVVALCPRRAAGGQPGVTPLSFKGKDALASTLSVMRWEAAEAPSPHQDENESESENGNAQDLLSETIRSRLVEELDGLLEQDRQRLDMGAMLMDSKARLNDWAHKAMCGAFKQEGRLPKALKRFDLGTSLKSSILVTALEGKYVADSFVVCGRLRLSDDASGNPMDFHIVSAIALLSPAPSSETTAVDSLCKRAQCTKLSQDAAYEFEIRIDVQALVSSGDLARDSGTSSSLRVFVCGFCLAYGEDESSEEGDHSPSFTQSCGYATDLAGGDTAFTHYIGRVAIDFGKIMTRTDLVEEGPAIPYSIQDLPYKMEMTLTDKESGHPVSSAWNRSLHLSACLESFLGRTAKSEAGNLLVCARSIHYLPLLVECVRKSLARVDVEACPCLCSYENLDSFHHASLSLEHEIISWLENKPVSRRRTDEAFSSCVW